MTYESVARPIRTALFGRLRVRRARPVPEREAQEIVDSARATCSRSRCSQQGHHLAGQRVDTKGPVELNGGGSSDQGADLVDEPNGVGKMLRTLPVGFVGSS
ncbi:MAG: hypothetical protein ABI269_06745 [Lapillicoccus sp.]